MAAANLLSTSTVNFQELIGNGRSYRVPPYQRDYSWTAEEWEDLWLDLMECASDPDGQHYMGAVVVKAESDRSYEIIDGQQRIATLTILGLSVIKRLTQSGQAPEAGDNAQRAGALRNRFIGEKDPASLQEISKLSLNAHDDGFFKDYLVQLRRPNNPKGLPKSNRLLWECMAYFDQKIGSDAVLSTDGLRLAELLSEVVARRLLFILITVVDEMSAYTVFETLNARGLELTTTDLLKTYLFSRISAPSDLESVQRRWHQLVLTVRQERFDEFLRYHYLTRYRKIRSGRLFKLVRDTVKTPAQVLVLLDDLEAQAEFFDAIGDPKHEYWQELPAAKPLVRDLALFRVRQMIPLLFAAYEKLPSEEFIKTLKFVVPISFRYTIIAGKNPNELEWAYHDAARSVLEEKATTAAQVFDVVKGIYVDDASFLAAFAQVSMPASGQRKRVAKYILCRLESDPSGTFRDFEDDPGTIEHILPENPRDEWEESIPREEWEEVVDLLGNLTLLRPAENRSIGRAAYAEKRPVYENSDYAVTRAVAAEAPEEWTTGALEARQLRMAKRACHVWRSDFV